MIPEKETIIKLIKVLIPDVKIYLFGSRARGNYTERSDIDLALDAGKPLSSLDIAKIKNIIDALNIPQMVDVVDFNRVQPELKEIIRKEGIPWEI
jgi:uncharacterized protein